MVVGYGAINDNECEVEAETEDNVSQTTCFATLCYYKNILLGKLNLSTKMVM